MSLDHRALVELGARTTIEQLAAQLATVVRTVPSVKTFAYQSMRSALGAKPLGRPRSESTPTPPTPRRKKPMLSREGRERLAASMRRRWEEARRLGLTKLTAEKSRRKRATAH